MKVLAERVLEFPLPVFPDQNITLIYGGEDLLTKTVDREMSITKLVIFDVEESDGLGGTGIGGAFIEEER